MATALTATPQATTPPSVLLSVTGAPSVPASSYSSAFGAGVDGWTASGTGVNTNLQTSGTGSLYLLATGYGNPAGNIITASKTISGLSVGITYRYRAMLTSNDPSGGTTRLRITSGATGVFVQLPTSKNTTLELLFTATATSHVINVDQQKTTGQESVFITNPAATTGAVTVAASSAWQGTRITRTDANGAAVPVRNPGNLDTTAGSMALTDYDAALSGTLSYTVTDGAGAGATATCSLAETRRNLVPNPLGPTLPATGYWIAARGTLAATADALRLTITDATVGVLAQRINTPLGTATRMPATPGAAHTATVGMRTNTAATGLVSVQWYDGAGAIIGSAVNGTAVALDPTAYTRVTLTATAPPLAAWLYASAGLGTGARNVGEWVDFQQALVERAAAPGTAFDGGSPYSSWTGAANNSASIQATPGAASTLPPSLTLPATVTTSAAPTYATVTLVTNYAEAAESQGTVHTVLGRTDKLSNPGTLLARAGALEFFCLDYDDARAIRELLKTGATALLRQADYPGMDLYFVARAVAITPAEPTPSRHWVTEVTYDEVPRP